MYHIYCYIIYNIYYINYYKYKIYYILFNTCILYIIILQVYVIYIKLTYRITLCNCLCSSSSPSSRDFASVIRNIGKFGAKNYFTDHGTANTIDPFRHSFPVLKKHGCY